MDENPKSGQLSFDKIDFFGWCCHKSHRNIISGHSCNFHKVSSRTLCFVLRRLASNKPHFHRYALHIQQLQFFLSVFIISALHDQYCLCDTSHKSVSVQRNKIHLNNRALHVFLLLIKFLRGTLSQPQHHVCRYVWPRVAPEPTGASSDEICWNWTC